MNDLISIIVPIYNVEKYLERCIITLVNQSYKNIEIILVCDGSPDKSGEICDKWSKKDNRIKVIHKENGGLSDARNKGLDIAKGNYICFVDSDDYVHKDYVKVLYELNLKYNADISVCGNYNVKGNEDYTVKLPKGNDFVSSAEDFLYKKKHFYCVAWGKLYKRKIFNNIRYPKGKIHEDVAVVHRILYEAKNIAVTDLKLYYYFVNENSIMRCKYSIKHLDILDNLYDSFNYFFNKKEEKIAFIILNDYIDNILKEYKNICTFKIKNKEVKKDILKRYKKEYMLVVRKCNLNFISKVKYIIYRYIPKLYILLSKN